MSNQGNQGIQGSRIGAQSIALRVPAPVRSPGLQPVPRPRNSPLKTVWIQGDQSADASAHSTWFSPPRSSGLSAALRWAPFAPIKAAQ